MSLPQSLASFVVDKPKENWRSFGDPSSSRRHVLCFADQAEQEAVFAKAGFVAPDGMDLPPDFSWPGIGDISVIGMVVDQDAVMGPPDKEGFPTIKTPATFLPGWYVNILVPEVEARREPGQVNDREPQAPLAITPRQARLALHSMGLLDQVNEMVAGGPAEMRIAWEFSNEVRRDDPSVMALAAQLGIGDRLPELFKFAATL